VLNAFRARDEPRHEKKNPFELPPDPEMCNLQACASKAPALPPPATYALCVHMSVSGNTFLP
jgi:hypothetical protein